MSEGSDTPPKFVPTLTEVVAQSSSGVSVLGTPASAAASDFVWPAETGELGDVLEQVQPSGAAVAPLDRRWLARRGIQGIPANLPPLPDSLPPQAFVSESAAAETALSNRLSVQATETCEVTTLNDSAGPSPKAKAQDSQAELLAVEEEVFPSIDTSFVSAAATLKAVETLTSSYETHEAIVQRSLYRVEQMIEMRLQETVAALLQEHVQTLSVQLHQQVEAIVRKSVQDVLKSTVAAARSKNENSI